MDILAFGGALIGPLIGFGGFLAGQELASLILRRILSGSAGRIGAKLAEGVGKSTLGRLLTSGLESAASVAPKRITGELGSKAFGDAAGLLRSTVGGGSRFVIPVVGGLAAQSVIENALSSSDAESINQISNSGRFSAQNALALQLQNKSGLADIQQQAALRHAIQSFIEQGGDFTELANQLSSGPRMEIG